MDVEQIASGRSVWSLASAASARVDDQGLVAELDEEVAQDIAEVDLILDDQHAHRGQSSTIGAELMPTIGRRGRRAGLRVLY